MNPFDDTLDQLQTSTPEGPASPPPPDNPFLETIDSLESDRVQRMRTATVQAIPQSPDRAAEVRKLSGLTGLAPEVVDRNFDRLKQRATADGVPYAKILAESPTVAAWSTEGNNAAVAKDDLEQLGTLEWIVTAPQRAFAQSIHHMRVGELRTRELMSGDLSQAERDQLNAEKFSAEAGGQLGAGKSWFRGAITGGSELLANVLGAAYTAGPKAALGGVVGGVIGGAGGALAGGVGAVPGAVEGAVFGARVGGAVGAAQFGFQLEAGLAFDEFVDYRDELGRPIDRNAARAAAFAAGVINAGLEAAGFEVLLKSFPGIDKLSGLATRGAIKQALRNPTIRTALADTIKGYAGTLTGETATEVAQRAVTILGGELAKASGSAPVPGQLEPGNVDLYKQPRVANPDGSISTVDSLSVNIDGREVLLPTVTPDGRHLEGPEAAIAEYQTTGRHLGIFATPAAATTFAQQLHEDYAKGTYDRPTARRSAGEIAADLAREAAGALQGFSLLAVGGPMLSLAHDVARVQRADQAQAFFTALREGAAQSKTIERLPEAAQEFLQRATADGPVETLYLPAEAFRTYFQSQADPHLKDADAVAAELTGKAGALEEAEASGADLAIPTAVYAVKLAGTPHHVALSQELRLGPDDMNAREATAFREGLAAQLEARKAETAEVTPAQQVRAQVVAELTGAGVPAQVADTYASLYEGVFGTLAENAELGDTARQLYEGYGLRVQRPDVQPGGGTVPRGTAAGTAETTPAAGPAPAGGAIGGLDVVPEGSEAEALLKAAVGPAERPAGPWDSNAAPGGAGGAAAASGAPLLPAIDPDAPLDVSDPVRAALLMMREDPTITRRAEELRARTAASRTPAPPRSGQPATEGVSSAPQPEGATRGDSTTTGGTGAADAVAEAGDGLQRDADQSVPAADVGLQPGGGEAARPAAGRRRSLPESYRSRFDAVAADARARGFTGSDATLLSSYLERLDTATTIAADLERDADQYGWRSILTAIAQAGGIGLADFPEDAGETMPVLDALAKSSGIITKSGRHAVKRQGQRVLPRSVGIKGAPGIVVHRGGLSWDGMREALAEDSKAFPPELRERWQNLAQFQDDVYDAALKGGAENKGEPVPGRTTPDVDSVLEQFLDVRPGGAAWWVAPANLLEEQDILEGDAAAAADDTDTSFNVEEFGQGLFDLIEPEAETLAQRQTGQQDLLNTDTVSARYAFEQDDFEGGSIAMFNIIGGPLDGSTVTAETLEAQGIAVPAIEPVDTLDTGEQQPRLPGAGQVREQDVATPAFEAPFALTSPVAKSKGKQTTLFQSTPIAPIDVSTFRDAIRERYGPDLAEFDLYLTSHGDLELDTIAVSRGAARQGLGTRVMQDLTMFADRHGVRILLSPSERGFQPEGAARTTSRSRLVQFYERFGFRRNVGRNRDFTTLKAMIRTPTARVTELGQPFHHGSPHHVDRFSTKHIGTGEGAAAYGWGLYFAENPAVAAGYFDQLSENPQILELQLGSMRLNQRNDFNYSRRASESDVENVRAALAEDLLVTPLELLAAGAGRIQAHVLKVLDTKIADYRKEWPAGVAAAESLRRMLEHPGAVSITWEQVPGGVYQVEIADAAVAKMADWDAPMSEQPAAVREAFGLTGDLEGAREAAAERYAATAAAHEAAVRANVEADSTTLPTHDAAERALTEWQAARRMEAEATVLTFGRVYTDYAMSPPARLMPELQRLAGEGKVTQTGSGKQIISELLAAHGVPGHRYLDQFSRDDEATRETHNVVVYTDDVVTLTHKDGTAVSQQERDEYFQEHPVGGAPAGPSRRGAIRFGADRQFDIDLLERADLSTFLHESGHFFLEVFGDLVNRVLAIDEGTRTDSQRRLVDDHRRLLEWLAPAGDREAQHEQFARGFEAYLMEGKAPSVELRSAFSRFRAWLLGIYRTLSGLNVTLTDDVRQVFDRMIATDRAIVEARAAGKVEALFTTPASAGMTPAEFAAYEGTVATASRLAREQLEARVLGEVHREQTAQWKARRADIETQVTTDVQQQPVYRALAAMRSGTHPDGSPLMEGEDLVPLKLSRAILVERYGADRLKRLPRPYIYSVDGGLDPDAMGETYGFDSGDAFLTAIENAPAMRDVIRRETDRRMLAEHGSLLLDGTLHEAAQAAIANEAQEEITRAELRALAKQRRMAAPFVRVERQAGVDALKAEKKERAYERRWFEAEARLRIAIAEGRKQEEIDALRDEIRALRMKARGGAAAIAAATPRASDLREMAQARIATLRIREIKAAPYWSASRRAAAQAVGLAARQDLDGAIVAKQQELISLALYREAQRVLEDVDKRVRTAKSYSTPAARARFGLAGEAYLDQVDGILDRYEFAKVSEKILNRRASLRKFVAAVEGEGRAIDLPEELLEEQRRINYREITYPELVGVVDGLEQLAHLARLKNALLKNAEARELSATTSDFSESIREHARRRRAVDIAGDRRPSEERLRTIADFTGSHRKLASQLRELDGFEDGGAGWSAVMRPLNDAGTHEAELQAVATRKFAELIAAAFPTAADKRALYNKTLVPAVGRSLSRMQRIMVAANWGNEGNRDRVRRSYNWTDEQVQTILDTLTASDLAFVQGILDLVNSYWPAIEAKQKRVYGVAPEKVEATAITAAAGTIPGGYFPLKYDDRLSAGAIKHLDLEAANLARQAAYAQATTKRGHTQARAEKVKLPVRLDFGPMFEHVQQVIHDLSHHEVLIDVGRILGHADVQTAILETQGDLVYKSIRGTIRDIAFGDVPATNGFERAINHVRTGATIAGLGWNLGVSLMQPLGLTNSMVRIGPVWVARGIARWIRSPATMVDTVRWVEEVSPFMRSRGRTMQREINEARKSFGVESGSLTGWVDTAIEKGTFGVATRQGIADSYFWMIQQAQRLADIPTWLGAYEKALAANEPEARAMALADQAVLDSQGGGQTKDLAQVQRGGPMMKLWTNFYSYFNVVLNQAIESHRRTRYRNPAEVGRLASDYFMLFIVPATMGFAVREVLRPHPDSDDDDLLWRIAMENVSYLCGTMLGLREVAGVFAGYAGYEGPGGARAFAALGRLGQQVRQGQADEALLRSLNEVAGVILHYPSGQAWKTASGIAAIAEGQTDNPGAVIAGPPPKRRQ